MCGGRGVGGGSRCGSVVLVREGVVVWEEGRGVGLCVCFSSSRFGGGGEVVVIVLECHCGTVFIFLRVSGWVKGVWAEVGVCCLSFFLSYFLTVVKSFTSSYTLLLLFFFRFSSISLHCSPIQFSLSFFMLLLMLLFTSLYFAAPSGSNLFFLSSLLLSP